MVLFKILMRIFNKQLVQMSESVNKLASVKQSSGYHMHENNARRLSLRTLVIFALFGVALISFSACTPQTKSVSVPVDTTRAFSEGGNAVVSDRWWDAFENERLSKLVDSALSTNFGLQNTWQRLRAAQAVVERESSSFFPTLDASAGGELSQYQTEFVQNQQLRLGLSSSYEVDLWGRIRSRVEASRYRARATRADYQTAALSLAAEVSRTWFQLSEAQRQLEVVRAQVATNEKVLSLLKARFGRGQIRSVDILRQQQLLEATREQETAAEARLQSLKHQLAVLLGQPPQQEVEVSTDSLPGLPALPETGLPTQLVRRRPDIRSAFNRLQAADREVAAAISNRYPRLSITASASTAADNANQLFQDWARSVAGNLLAPLFYGGQLQAEVDRTQAVKQQRLYEYGQTVLTAFREVENALMREKKQKETIQSIRRQLSLARQAYEQLRLEYFNGMSGYLDVLTALEEMQQLRRDLLTAQRRLLEYRVSLYRSLAGGVEMEDAPGEQ